MTKIFTIIFILISFNCFSQDINSGLILYLPFNGNANDASGNGLNGTVNGATLTQDKDGNSNSAYQFDAADEDFINVPENVLLRPDKVSVSAWFKAASDNIIYPIVYKGTVFDTTAYQYSLQFLEEQNNDVVFLSQIRTDSDCGDWINDGEPYVEEIAPITYGTWHHLASTYDGTDFITYLDGTLIATTSAASPQDIFDCPGGGLNVGAVPTVLGETTLVTWFFDGAIDEVRVYNRELTGAEVAILAGSVTGNKMASMDAFFSVSPNPSSDGKYTLSTSMNLRSPQFTMVDYMGKQVSFDLLENGQTYSLDINNQPKGIYYLMIKDGDKVSTQKLVHQ